jgi:hypothetical protein
MTLCQLCDDTNITDVWHYHLVTVKKNAKILGFLSTATKPSKCVWLSWQLFPGQRGQLPVQHNRQPDIANRLQQLRGELLHEEYQIRD